MSSTSSPHTSHKYPFSQTAIPPFLRHLPSITVRLWIAPSRDSWPMAEEVVHRVEPRRLPVQEFGRVERTMRESVAVQGPVRELEALAHEAEDDGVLAGVVARAQGVHADLA